MCERNTHWLSLAHPQPGDLSATQARALTGSRTSDLSDRRPVLNPLSHTSQGLKYLYVENGHTVDVLQFILFREHDYIKQSCCNMS